MCLVGDSGAGKSTAAWILGHRLAPCARVDVARPLHEACDYIYREAGLIPPNLRGVQRRENVAGASRDVSDPRTGVS